MFDPHIYGCQSIITGSTSNPSIQSAPLTSDGHMKNNFSPASSPQKSKHVNSNTVIPIQNPGNATTPKRKPSKQEDDGHHVESHNNINEIHVNNMSVGSGSNSGENSRKTSTISDYASSECTPENTILTPRQDNEYRSLPMEQQQQVKQSPARKLSRFLVSPTVIETANKELIVQEDVTPHLAASSQQNQQLLSVQQTANGPQHQHHSGEIENMNINDESYQRIEQVHQVNESELQPQQSIGFRMPETLEQLKIELENITHAHVSTTKPMSKEIVVNPQVNTQVVSNSEANDAQDDNTTADTVSEAQVENSMEYTSTDQIVTTEDNTSVYNSRRTSADMITNPTDLTSTASGAMDYEENLVSEEIDENKSNVLPQQIER